MMSRLLVIIAALLFTVTAQAATPYVLQPYMATYKANYNGMDLTAVHQISQQGNSWLFETVAQGFIGRITETSTFFLDSNGNIVSQHYLYNRELIGNTRRQEIQYNWGKKEAYSTGKKSATLPLVGGELDKSSYILQIKKDIANGNNKPCYTIIDKDRKREYCFEKTGEEVIQTALGPIATVRFERSRNDNERSTVFWLATELDYLMVKLVHKDKNGEDGYTLLLQTTDLLGKKP